MKKRIRAKPWRDAPRRVALQLSRDGVGVAAGVAALLSPHARFEQLADLDVDGGHVLNEALHDGAHIPRLDRVQPVAYLHALAYHLRYERASHAYIVVDEQVRRLTKRVAQLALVQRGQFAASAAIVACCGAQIVDKELLVDEREQIVDGHGLELEAQLGEHEQERRVGRTRRICGEVARHLGYVLEIGRDEELAHVLLAEGLVEVHLGAEADVRADERLQVDQHVLDLFGDRAVRGVEQVLELSLLVAVVSVRFGG